MAIPGKGRVKHGDFEMGSADLSETEFIAFLTNAFMQMARLSTSGSLHYLCMDWRHQYELLGAGRAVFARQIDLCVWAKGQPTKGTPYQQQYELVAVFKHGRRPHVDNVELGRHGRNRSNLWSYSRGPEQAGRRARLIELDPYYCDVTIRRFESLTGVRAVAQDGSSLVDRERQCTFSNSEESTHA